jgi:hypothetical protein
MINNVHEEQQTMSMGDYNEIMAVLLKFCCSKLDGASTVQAAGKIQIVVHHTIRTIEQGAQEL